MSAIVLFGLTLSSCKRCPEKEDKDKDKNKHDILDRSTSETEQEVQERVCVVRNI
ncbi:hypothetical protein AGMMS50222_05530 [Endomicrobiia bacterium]|nr:hypothetical protein AGMMS49556_09660 [Endomicrobiia bacterium]GHT75129.1 hypothetical protein AGMMS50222_05530 [Endomicrobiia bacterium]